MNKKLLTIFILIGLSGCVESNTDDLKDWMKTEESKLKGKIDELPESKTFTPISYAATTNPFVVKEKVNLKNLLSNQNAPDTKREKDELEVYSLDTLKMTGTITKDGKVYAMIKDKNNSIHYVSKGNYMGLNDGKIIEVSDSEILLEEKIQENDNWIIRNAKISLYEGNSAK